MELREKIAEIIAPYVPSPGWGDAVADSLPIADAILSIPEIRDALLIAEQTTESDKKRKLAWARS